VTRMAIFGASGFVGSTLLNTSHPSVSHLTLIDPVQPDPAVLQEARHRHGSVDVRRGQELRADADPGNVDVLLVLAGKTDVDEALADPALAFTANAAIAVEVGEWWRRHPATRVVYLSSDEVLGASNWPLNENDPYRPTQPYAASKAAAEMTLRCYSDTYGLDLVVIRSCNLVGGRQRARKLIPITVLSLASRQPVPVFGTGLQVREYLAVEDLCNVLWMATDGGLPSGIYNCTSAIGFTVLEVVDVIAAALGVHASRVHVADRLVQDQAYAMDSSLLHSFGWKPKITPTQAMTRAATDLHTAWQHGEDLTTPHGQVYMPESSHI
jgi:dTDP-glucose 4,6-dehydratase